MGKHGVTWYGRTWQESFWSKIDRRGPDDCWCWMAYRNRDGYGRFNQYGKYGHTKLTMAHRIAYELTYGDITDPSTRVLHRCDNPPCCNPNHLTLGTQVDNIHDAMQKKRMHVKRANPPCHPDRPYCARNMCKPCYERDYRERNSIDKKYHRAS